MDQALDCTLVVRQGTRDWFQRPASAESLLQPRLAGRSVATNATGTALNAARYRIAYQDTSILARTISNSAMKTTNAHWSAARSQRMAPPSAQRRCRNVKTMLPKTTVTCLVACYSRAAAGPGPPLLSRGSLYPAQIFRRRGARSMRRGYSGKRRRSAGDRAS